MFNSSSKQRGERNYSVGGSYFDANIVQKVSKTVSAALLKAMQGHSRQVMINQSCALCWQISILGDI